MALKKHNIVALLNEIVLYLSYMKENLLIYGCYGYTGYLISKLAAEKNLKNIILAGRDAIKTKAVADELKLPYRVFDLQQEQVETELKNIKAVLHCAGPFKYTSSIMANACIKTNTHYLDITGEIDVFESLQQMSKSASDADIILMPGVGFDVVPSDCLALYLKEQMPDAKTLELILMSVGGMLSHGTSITIIENMHQSSSRREQGKIISTRSGANVKEFDFGFARKVAVEIPWGDVSTAFYTTGIPNITVYNALPKSLIKNMQLGNYFKFLLSSRLIKNFLIKKVKQRPAGPDEKMRTTSRTYILGIASNDNQTRRAVLELPEGYWITAQTAIAIAIKVMNNQIAKRGFLTPAAALGSEFILQFDNTKRSDLT